MKYLLQISGIACVLALSTPGFVRAQQRNIVDMTKQHLSGQNVVPAYEGWLLNSDGTVTLYFGYMNRNYEEIIDIPVGPDNHFEPKDVDRGQPSHFLPRRLLNVFSVRVPRDFGRLEWVVSSRGKTERAVATMNPEIMFDGTRDSASGYLAPVVTIAHEITTIVGQTTPLTVSATHESERLTVEWAKYRGSGEVKFESNVQPLMKGAATTTAVFTEPGEHVILATVRPARSGRICCWTNSYVQVKVNAESEAR